MPFFHIFNPGHETAVLLGSLNYTAPANVASMTKDLACLPLWYAGPEDLIYMGKEAMGDFIKSLPEELGQFASPFIHDQPYTQEYMAMPWGLSPHIIHVLRNIEKKEQITLHTPEWKAEYKALTSRQGTIECHQLLFNKLPQYALPSPPVTVNSTHAVEAYLATGKRPVVLKTPFSSSGRGVFWLRETTLTNAERNWINGAIQRQGFVSLEQGLEKTVDFAMEFYSDGAGSICYEGLSIFDTEQKGAYNGNILASQAELHKELVSIIGEHKLNEIKRTVAETLQSVYSHTYKGYLGVDMLLYKRDGQIAIHPCVEVNMRFTMGLVALRLFERYIHPEAKGNFHITFDKEPGLALKKHNELKEKHPLQFFGGYIKKGYLSLCPISEQTHYRAYILIEQVKG